MLRLLCGQVSGVLRHLRPETATADTRPPRIAETAQAAVAAVRACDLNFISDLVDARGQELRNNRAGGVDLRVDAPYADPPRDGAPRPANQAYEMRPSEERSLRGTTGRQTQVSARWR